MKCLCKVADYYVTVNTSKSQKQIKCDKVENGLNYHYNQFYLKIKKISIYFPK